MRAAELTELAEQSLRERGASWMRREVRNHNAHARADIAAIVEGKIVFVEVKGAGDSARRLLSQLLGYGPSADQIEVWACDALVEPCKRIAAGEGYATVRSPRGIELSPTASPPRVLWCVLALLVGPELAIIAEDRGCARGVRGKGKSAILDRLIANGITVDEAQTQVARFWPIRDWEWYQRQRLTARQG